MKNIIRILFPTCVALFLVACGQSAPDTAESSESEPAAAASSGGDKLVSIDADGNIAPFGFASKQPVAVPEAEAATEATAAAEQVAAASSETYSIHCVACHGPDAKGVEGLGLNLVASELVASSTAEELTAFLKEGRLPDSPDSVTGIPMPAFAWMNAEQLAEITTYLKAL